MTVTLAGGQGRGWGTDRAPSSSHTRASGPYEPEHGAQAAFQASRLARPRWPPPAAKQTVGPCLSADGM